MIIGIDIDDCLNNEYSFMIDYGSKYSFQIGGSDIIRIDSTHTSDIFGWPDETAHEFWHKFMPLFSTLPAVPFASEVIKKLRDEGNKIYIITARHNGDEWYPKDMAENLTQITLDWLKRNKIEFDEIFFDAKNKGEVCEEKQVDIMIDDDPFNLNKIKGKTKAFVFDKPYNKDIKLKDYTRVFSWYDIYAKIKKLEI